MSILEEMMTELWRLVDSKAAHTARAHETKKGCDGCRRLEIVNLMRDYLRFEDDTRPQDQFGGRSRKDVELSRIEAGWRILSGQ